MALKPHSLRPYAEASRPDPRGTAHRLRILLVDDHAGVREALRETLSDHPQLEVIAEASDGVEGVVLARAVRPDVIVMDVTLPRLDGVGATRRIHASLPHVVILGLSSEVAVSRHPIEEAGAVGFFSKTDGAGPLVDRLLAIQALRESMG